nr:immunoglobulin light chain junction region [Macaca mulatta]MPO00642.1 immunoglobulin light chain junction region [Macaca mulatta]
YQQYNSLPLTF